MCSRAAGSAHFQSLMTTGTWLGSYRRWTSFGSAPLIPQRMPMLNPETADRNR